MTKQKYRPLRRKVIVRILDEDRDRNLKKKVLKEDGSHVFIYTTTTLKIAKDDYGLDTLEEMGEADNRKSEVFVRSGIIEEVGEDVTSFKKGQNVLLDYGVDNEINCFVGWDGKDKIVSLMAETTYFKEDVSVTANGRTQYVAHNGEVKDLAQIIAIIRGKDIIANHPYVILKHKEIPNLIVTSGGILSSNAPENIEREVVGVSDYSSEKYGIKKGQTVVVRELDTFEIVWDGQKVTAVDDRDVMAKI